MRRSVVTLAALAFVALSLVAPRAEAGDFRERVVAMAQQSQQEGKGLTLFLQGHEIAVVVTAVHGSETIEGRNQQYGRVVIDLAEVVAAAFQ